MNLPGFVDLQVNGYAGVDFNDPDTKVNEILESAEILLERGTAGFLATVVTNSREVIEQCVNTIAKAIERQGKNGNILGIHLEGPFVSPEYGFRGIHPEKEIIAPDLKWFQKLQRLADGHIRLVTIAPEQKNSVEFIRAVTPQVIVSVGHSNCSFDDIGKAVDAGLKLATHFGNGCRQQIDRHNNPLFNILAHREITLCFISDGFHLPEAFIRMLTNCRPVEKLIVVSDSVKFAEMPPGNYRTLDGTEIVMRKDGRLCLASDTDILAGSSYNMMKCMNHLAEMKILSEEQLWQVGYSNALKVLNINPTEFRKRVGYVKYDPGIKRFVIEK